MNPTRAILASCFLVSGAAGLLFETLWFRTLGLAVGNSVWASALVLAAFMGGLALGNGLAAWKGQAITRPIRAYALLEVAIAGLGLVLVFVLPALGTWLGPLLRPWLDTPGVLNPLRGGVALLLLLLPCTAMGAGLPLVVRALAARDQRFGEDLGLLYGLNTLGAVAGAVLGEAVLIHHLGVRGTAWVAAALDVAAAVFALLLSRRVEAGLAPERTPRGRVAPDARARLLMAAAFLGGLILLALEVLWFRFLQLFVQGTSVALALTLAAVLCGISAGSFLAAALLRRFPGAAHAGAAVALLGGAATLWTYASFPYGGSFVLEPDLTARFALRLMFVPCLLSGLLFTVLGAALRERVPAESQATGLLTLANTGGAMVGALVGGFVLLPGLGIERSLLVLGLGYAMVAALAFAGSGRTRETTLAAAVGLAAFATTAGLFPLGLMQNHFLAKSVRRYTVDGYGVVAVREGLTETITYLRQDRWGRPLAYRLLTNGYSMSGSAPLHRRYMKLFVYLPVMMRPEARRALLISYGVGSTASALTDTKSLERVDVVDISPDILDMSRIVFTENRWPLADPRVRVHVEDGRFFLRATDERWDIITSEPPPPKNAGITNLYSREFFALMHARLVDGGVATHWLPIEQMTVADAQAIVGAFCSVFTDCTLWNGAGYDWVLAGTRAPAAVVDELAFTAQWRDPVVSQELHALGLDTPELLGATFLGDAADLVAFAGDVAPLTDDRPGRLSQYIPQAPDPAYLRIARAGGARERFERSPWVRAHWPQALREPTLAAFAHQRFRTGETVGWNDLVGLLRGAAPRTVVLHALGSSLDEQRLAELALAEGRREPLLLFRASLGALARRDPRAADRLLAAGAQALAESDPARTLFARNRLVALCLAGEPDAARAVAPADSVQASLEMRAWLRTDCGL